MLEDLYGFLLSVMIQWAYMSDKSKDFSKFRDGLVSVIHSVATL